MRLLKLRISNFALFHNKNIKLSNGLNLIYGKNEAGKSTIHGFIKGMLFGIEKGRGRASINDPYERYQPWKNPGSYDGSLDFEVNKIKYHIYRNFDKNNKEMVVTDVNTGRQLELNQLELQELMGGLTEAGYNGTISIEQLKAKTDQDMAFTLQNYITNLTTTKNVEIDVKKGIEELQKKGKEYNTKELLVEIENTYKKIKEGEKKEEKLDELSLRLKQIAQEEKRLIEKSETIVKKQFSSKEAMSQLFANFPLIKTQYGHYNDYLLYGKEIKERILSLKNDIKDKKDKETYAIELASSLEGISNKKNKISELKKEKDLYKKSNENRMERQRKNILLYTSPLIGLGFLIAIFTYNKSKVMPLVGIVLSFFSFIILFVIFQYQSNKAKKNDIRINKIDKRIENMEKEIGSILRNHRVLSELELREKYEEAYNNHMSINQWSRQLSEQESQYELNKDKILELKKQIMEYVNHFYFILPEHLQEEMELCDEMIGILDEYIIDQQLDIDYYQENIKPKLDGYAMEKERIKWEIESLEENEDELIRNQGIYQELLDKQKRYEEESKSINIAIKALQDLSINIHDSFGNKLNHLMSSIASDITGGKYQDIKVDEKLRIKTEVGDRYQYLERLSTGAIEQLYFSLRFAISDLMYGENKMPILLDDTFAYYDDLRLEKVLKILSKNQERQILLFTCHNREKEILDRIKSSYHYIEL